MDSPTAMPTDFASGIDRLLGAKSKILHGSRFGLVAHQASVDATGALSAARLREKFGDGLAAIFSPEHGLFGIAGAGDKVDSIRHPAWQIPVHSLYGKTRRPTRDMLRGLDAIVFDLQDLSIRCYTYVSTLRYVMEAAAESGVRVIVTDRANPLAGIMDGPLLDPRSESFVGCLPGPLVYGLTAGEAAIWLRKKLALRVELEVIPMRGYRYGKNYQGPRWVSPSPAIRHPHSALCYPLTVGFEALPAIDYGRKTLMPFELIGSPSLDEGELSNRLNEQKLPGIQFHPALYEREGMLHRGVRIAVLDASVYRPVASAVAVLNVLQTMIGVNRLWRTPGSRPAFFDQLFGTDKVRRALQAGVAWKKIATGWPLAGWRKAIKDIQLYRSR